MIEQRKRVDRLLRDSPSLKPRLPELISDAYDSAVRWAADETGNDESDFPQVCPYSIEQILVSGFYSDAEAQWSVFALTQIAFDEPQIAPSARYVVTSCRQQRPLAVRFPLFRAGIYPFLFE